MGSFDSDGVRVVGEGESRRSEDVRLEKVVRSGREEYVEKTRGPREPRTLASGPERSDSAGQTRAPRRAWWAIAALSLALLGTGALYWARVRGAPCTAAAEVNPTLQALLETPPRLPERARPAGKDAFERSWSFAVDGGRVFVGETSGDRLIAVAFDPPVSRCEALATFGMAPRSEPVRDPSGRLAGDGLTAAWTIEGEEGVEQLRLRRRLVP